MRKNSNLKKPAFVSRIAVFALLFVTMAAATLHIGAPEAQAAQASLSWTAPTTYTDGKAITGLGGYKIYTGTASGNYTQNITVGNVTSYTLANLNDATTYYFAVTAYDTAGVVSGFSNQATLTTPGATTSTLYTLTASAGSGGTITPAGSVVISKGTSQAYTITPATGYKIAGVTVDGASVGAVASYTFSSVAANHTIAATFASSSTTTASYTIAATAYANGSISPAGTTTLASGTSKTYSIIPAAGYKVSSVKVDGVSVGAVTSYAFNNVTANHTIAASFVAGTTTTASYTISATAYANGSISPAGTTTLTSGTSKTYTITPATGYQVSSLKVDGISVTPAKSYAFNNVAANHTIAVSFKVL
jgi:hypothetical protein